MKEIRLLSLKLNNFKGCEHFVLTLDGRSASIYGDNAAGKTTIYDAVTWLLFGKDSEGRGDFEIKPLDSSGQVKDHAAITEVEAVFLADGSAVTFRKTFFERWSTKRGSVETSYDGNTSEYFVDDVPTKKYEFERRVDELVNEELFRTLTNVSWFCEQLDWKSRRKLLLEVCEVPEDQEIMAANEQFAPLTASIGNLSLDDHKKKLAAQRKGLNGTRNTIPARLDEQKKTIESLAGIDFAVLRVERDTKAARLDQLSSELLKLGHGALLDGKRNELVRVKNELTAYLNENNSYRQSQMVPIQDERPALNAGLELAKKRLARSAALAANEKELIDSISEMIEGCRTSWSSVDAETFRASNCPTCGQPLPADAQTVARSKFDADKERRKAEIVAAADREKRNLEAARFRRESYINDAVAAENEAARLENALRTYIPRPRYYIRNGEQQRCGGVEQARAAIRQRDRDRQRLRHAGAQPLDSGWELHPDSRRSGQAAGADWICWERSIGGRRDVFPSSLCGGDLLQCNHPPGLLHLLPHGGL